MLRVFLILVLSVCVITARAGSWSADVSYGTGKLIAEGDSKGVYGFRGSLSYLPDTWRWGNFNIFMNGSIAYWKTSNSAPNRNITIYAIAPFFRYYVFQGDNFKPFVEASVGAAYFSRLTFNNRNLGAHYTFQDIFGFGSTFGDQQRWSASVHIMHYSNASLAKHNGGLTVPLVFSVGYQF